MTQAQLDLQDQPEHTSNTDLRTQPILNDSPVLFLEVMDQAPSLQNTEQNSTAQIDYPISPEKHCPFPETNNYDQSHRTSQLNNYEQSHGTPPPSKKRYEMMKDPAALSSPIFSPILRFKPSLSTNRDDHLIPLLSHKCFIFKSQPTSLYIHPTNYTFKLYDKNQDFFNLQCILNHVAITILT